MSQSKSSWFTRYHVAHTSALTYTRPASTHTRHNWMWAHENTFRTTTIAADSSEVKSQSDVTCWCTSLFWKSVHISSAKINCDRSHTWSRDFFFSRRRRKRNSFRSLCQQWQCQNGIRHMVFVFIYAILDITSLQRIVNCETIHSMCVFCSVGQSVCDAV